MKWTRDAVKKVAKLANLPITDSEEKTYATQLSKILDYIEQLGKVSTLDVKPTFNVTGLSNVMGSDQVVKSLPQKAVLQNTQSKNGFFVTRGVFKEE